MSILIKGMEMPTDCCQCKLARYDDYENETFCPFTNVMCLSIGRQDDCPLEEALETHDKRTETLACDLIDRQAAIDALEREKTYCRAFREGYAPVDVFEKYNAGLTDGIKAISSLPSAQPEWKWIPCSERLSDKEVLCCDTRGEMIIGYPYQDEESNTGYSAVFDDVVMIDCTAWMSLPEPYRGEGD